MNIHLRKTFTVVLAAVLLAGCTVISKEAMKAVDEKITLTMVQEHPENYIGKKVLWGGTILSTDNREKVSEIEVLESKLAYDRSPADGGSEGRFIVESGKFLDSNVYKTNKRLTVAGTVKGTEVRKIGKMDYTYPVIVPFEMRLFEPPSEQPPYNGYPSPYMHPFGPYGPYGPYGPWYPSPWPSYPYGPSPYGPYPYRPYPY